MSNPLKKIVKGIKKVFKKIVKVVKKVLKSKIFKVIVAAVAIYFAVTTGGAALGLWGGGAPVAPAALGGAPISTGVPTFVAETAATIGGSVAPPAAAAATGMSAGTGAFASAALTTGGNMLSAYAKGKEEEERLEVLKKNSETKLDIYGIYAENQKKAGAISTDAGGNTNYDSPVQQAANVEKPEQSFYNGANDSWSPVQKVARNTNKTAASRDTESNV